MMTTTTIKKEKERKGKKVACVTGGTGYLASMLVKHLLERGYTVNATVRDPESDKIGQVLGKLGSLQGELKLFKADLVVEGSFDEAVSGCDYVFHVALPGGLLVAEDPVEDLINPAIQGTLNVLRSCVKAADTVKRVVYTSSSAAVSASSPDDQRGRSSAAVVVDEDAWTDVDLLTTEKPPTWGYLVAKTLAEKEAWSFAEKNGLDLVAINPVLVVGPGLTPHPSLSNLMSLAFLTGDSQAMDGLKTMETVSGSISIVHLQDVCDAHIFAAEKDEAYGRYIVSKINTSVKKLGGFLHQRYPQYCKSHAINLDVDDVDGETNLISISSEKIIKAGFRFKYEDLGQVYDEIIVYGLANGVLMQPKEAEKYI